MNNFQYFEKIEIPIIQRDYVLGRDDAKEIRKKFLNDLFNALENNEVFHLDFVYGQYNNGTFIPIDGQQRLTTLFLLYWYFARKENKNYKVDFKYRTRKSAEEFCEFLWEVKDIDFSQDKISSQLKNHKKFIPFWEFDPTVESMLIVLDEIHKRGKYKEYFDKLEKITFSIFELDIMDKQAEELYRKMNSRGKVLTELENFKTIYEQIAYKEGIWKYKQIAEKFEKNWSNFFWKYKDENYLIDNPFMNLIRFITEMRSYENGKNYEDVNIYSFNYLREFYKSKDNFSLLEECLDNLKRIESVSKYIEGKFIFFGKNERINLFVEVLRNYDNMTNTNKILAYLMIKAVLKITDIEKDLNRVLDLLRISRNDLHRQRTLKRGKIEYTLTIENKDIPQLIKGYMPLIKNIKDKDPYEKLLEITPRTESLKHEKEKAELIIKHGVKQEIHQLEDFKYLKGDLRIFLSNKCNFIKDKAERMKFINKKFISLFNNPDNLICRALLAIGDYSIWLGTVCRGDKYFFGQKGYWEIFFTYKARQIKVSGDKEEFEKRAELYSQFFSKLQNKSLQEIIDEKLHNYENRNKDWIYYFLKYPIILSNLNDKNLKNVFGWVQAWEENANLNTGFIEKLEKETQITSYHINVILLALLNELLDNLDEFQDLSKYLHNDNNCSTYLVYKDKKIEISSDKIIVDGKEIPLYENKDAVDKAKVLLTSSIDL
ncbi:DUF262 domain-containing protein [Desulfurobacterium atlanticum]|uniref:GmrSD restriction endonucleases N-terminal domain-containing protein n=1 Tax=Desulfurobacterium atlanticum TaxID=240169 RepID=A0A238Y2T4_9BACT|nr:DUF262 domain-containing protein [Desulfurobacterium atlanticum]SNR65437.1 Protein of unknown function DUF262 [Desulfurobacterium atlanticum]